MQIFDLHTDTASEVYKTGKIEKFINDKNITQVLAMFYDCEKVNYDYDSLYNIYIRMLNFTKIVTRGMKTKYIYAIEDGGIINRNLDRIDELYSLGVKIITLTWNYPNFIGFPYIEKDKGLTDFGKELVRIMNQKEMIIDVSHLSDEGFYEVAEISRKPIIASHSNARAICHHPRNLKDDMIKIIANSGGVIGINFYNKFLSNSGEVSLEIITEHIKHIKNIGGIDCVAIGSDFDGFDLEDNMPIKNTKEIRKLGRFLLKNGFSNEEIEKIMYKNAERVLLN